MLYMGHFMVYELKLYKAIFNVIIIKIPANFFIEINKLIFKYIWKFTDVLK